MPQAWGCLIIGQLDTPIAIFRIKKKTLEPFRIGKFPGVGG